MNDLFGAAAPRRGKPAPLNGKPGVRNGTPDEANYTAASIEVLEGLEPVRRRPGMYVGGTDSNALHHLFAEVIDNAMDEAVAGHATFIEVSLEDSGYLSVVDNGRGMPVDPHPKFPKKSALEVIMTMLHAGGKFDSGAYETSGGLHGVGVSVVNALSEKLEVEVARAQTLYRQTFERGKPTSKLTILGKTSNRRGTKVRFLPDPQIFGAQARFDPARVFKMARSKAYLFGGVEIRWRCAPALISDGSKVPAEATFHFPGGLRDYLAADIEGEALVADQVFTGRVEKAGKHGSVEWAIAWLAGADGFVHSYCNTIPTPDGGAHEAGLRTALLRGLKDHADRIGQGKRAAALTADDVMVSCAALISVFIREPEFQGQNKGRLQTAEAARLVDGVVRDAFDHWLAAAPSQAAKLLDWGIERAEERVRRRMEKEVARKTAVRKLRLPGKLADCTNSSAQGSELFIVEGDFSGRFGQAGARSRFPGRVAAQGKDPQCRVSRARQACAKSAALRSDAGARRQRWRPLPFLRSSLRQDNHHDRRGRRRRSYRLASDHLLLPANAETDRGGAPLSRRPAALSSDSGSALPLRAR